MKINYLNKLSQLALMTTFILMMTGCTEALSNFFSDDIEEGEEVLFTTALPSVATTRTTEEEDKYNKQMEAYQAVNKAYEFTVEMYEGGNVVGTSTYKPAGGDSIGTLSIKSGATPLYWTSTTKPYAFNAVAGTKTLEADQSNPDKWLLQDRLEGYGYVQLWDSENNKSTDDLNALNYHTAKEWKARRELTQMAHSLMKTVGSSSSSTPLRAPKPAPISSTRSPDFQGNHASRPRRRLDKCRYSSGSSEKEIASSYSSGA